ncbi:MAG: hypothetical protein LBS76_02965, partial [Mycoplasmataceae bacterium]|nr:hypothetical protein [Mycoplasmataceae bacterium]
MKTIKQHDSWDSTGRRDDGKFSNQSNNVLTHKEHKIWLHRRKVKAILTAGGILLGAGVACAIVLPITLTQSITSNYQITSDKASLKFGSADTQTILTAKDNGKEVDNVVYSVDDDTYCEIESGTNILKLKSVAGPIGKHVVDITAEINGVQINADTHIDIYPDNASFSASQVGTFMVGTVVNTGNSYIQLVGNNGANVNSKTVSATGTPAGLTLVTPTSADGKLTFTGTPTTAGTFSITITVDGITNTTVASLVVLPETQSMVLDNTLDQTQSYFVSSYYVGTQSFTCPTNTKMLDLKAYATAKGCSDNFFVINGTVNYGILIDYDQSVSLYGINDGTIQLGTLSQPLAGGAVIGIAVGNIGSSSTPYSGNLLIDKSVVVNIYSSSTVFGIYFYSTAANSTQTISGTFTISTDGIASGVVFASTVAGNTTISGTFTISSTSGSVYGVYFDSTVAGNTTISGTFTISSTSGSAYGVYFASAIAGNTTISGTFTISTDGVALGVIFYSTAAGSTQTISGTFTISSTDGCGVYFVSTAANSTQIVSTTIVFFAIADDTSNPFTGVGFEGSMTDDGSLTMTGTQFFSNKEEFNTLFVAYPSDDANHNYKWNGADMSFDSHNSAADSSLTLMDVPDRS